MKKPLNMPIYSGASPEKVMSDLKPLVEFQNHGISLEALQHLIEERLIPHLIQYDRPEFQSLFNFFPEHGAEFGGKIALKYNQGVTNWQVSPGAVMMEELCCRALCELFNLSPNSDATFMYCGTYSNQSALYLALHWSAEQRGFDFAKKGVQGFKDPSRLVAVTSQEAHFSLKHALRIMGLGEQSLVTLPVDTEFKIDIKTMQEYLSELHDKKDIFCVVATAGTTSTGSVDPILPIAEICNEYGIWLHVDGAYGLAYFLVPEWKHLFVGLELADSITWDPHKQFGVPIPNSLLFLRRKEDFDRMAMYGDYWNRKGDPEPNPGLKSPPSTRPFSALPLITSIRHLGLQKLIQNLRTPLSAVETVYENLMNNPEIELCHKPDLGILCIRVTPEGFPEKHLDQLQKYVYDRTKTEGKRSISLTKIQNKTVLRLVIINELITPSTIMETIKYIKALAKEYHY
ncbi:MAG: aspartate aminotransferase family protein [Candidatus Heimdallarchaeota archaeon]|nr:MAG: aspartate aminotransferase family protein [Candidatus Heimdallarchaeota archaeon]